MKQYLPKGYSCIDSFGYNGKTIEVVKKRALIILMLVFYFCIFYYRLFRNKCNLFNFNMIKI